MGVALPSARMPSQEIKSISARGKVTLVNQSNGEPCWSRVGSLEFCCTEVGDINEEKRTVSHVGGGQVKCSGWTIERAEDIVVFGNGNRILEKAKRTIVVGRDNQLRIGHGNFAFASHDAYKAHVLSHPSSDGVPSSPSSSWAWLSASRVAAAVAVVGAVGAVIWLVVKRRQVCVDVLCR